jgi:hypothetical protein
VTNIAIIFILLLAPYLVAWVFRLNVIAGGRIGISAVLLFAAIGHFFKTEQMMQMLPSFWQCPMRSMLVCASSAI